MLRLNSYVYENWFCACKGIDRRKKNEQKEFLEKELEIRLAESKSGNRTVYFADAAHFVCGFFLGLEYCPAVYSDNVG